MALAVLATGIGVAMATTATAFSEHDDILIDEVGYDVGGDGFTSGTPDEPATLSWEYSSTFGTRPVLEGKIHFDGVDRCARVLLISYDRDVETGRTTSDEECPATAGHHARAIEVQGDTMFGQPGAEEAQVVLQTEQDGRWVRAGSQLVTFGPELDVDTAQILRAEFDLGAGDFVAGAPEGSATVRWQVTDTGKIAAILSGTLYAKNADDACVEVEVRYKDDDGDVIDVRRGTRHCLTDDDLHTFLVSNGTNFEDYALRQVTYALMKDGVQVGATTVELGDGPVFSAGGIISPILP